ncbi:MAG: hypothetical protein ACUVT6_02820 [Thermodesulfobacteriota bacterium]
MTLRILSIVILSWIFTFPSVAIDSQSNRATLKDLPGVGVLVEKLPGELEREGLRREQLQRGVESQLRKAGIKVFSREECSNIPGEPYLYLNLNVNISKTESNLYPYTIDVMLIQKVSLVRDPNRITYAITWSTGGVGSITKSIVSQLRDNVAEVVDIFIQRFLAENPK